MIASVLLYIYLFWWKMDQILSTICFNSDMKCPHILSIVFLSIDLTISSITFLPESFSKSMIIDVLLDLICFFSIPKNNSTGASSGEYCGKNTPVKFDSFIWLWTFSDRWIEELSMIMQIFSLFRPIVCCKQLACDLSIQRMI